MIACGLRIPPEDAGAWLDALAAKGLAIELELAADLLDDIPEARRFIQRSALRAMVVRDIIDCQAGRYLEELAGKAFDQVLASAIRRVGEARTLGARLLTLDLGLERVFLSKDQERLTRPRLAFLRRLCPVAADKGITLCAPVRFPPDSPAADALKVGANLIYDLGVDNFRVCLNLFPNDMPGGLEARALIRQTGSLAALVRLFYSPELGEELEAVDVRALVAALQWHEFAGGVVFCPGRVAADRIVAVCEQVAELLEIVRVEQNRSRTQ